eukprot:TRINITY_DN2927_c0_g2_i1.p1 TRINITY_DN2927_c0_g2~~TRINITY_DN2927_c0_g2_i1.p1  ORF type:complete len:224 (-),score=51.85 TRINITY_DN2927_c0_g2_i1:144-815(-)
MAPTTTQVLPRAVVFDMGGVLANATNYSPLFDRLAKDVDKKFIREVVKESWNQGKVIPGFSAEDYWRPIMDAAGVPAEEEDIRALDEQVKEGFLVFWQVLAVVDRVKKAGLRVGIISNHMCGWFDHWFARFSLSDLFTEPELVLVSSRLRSAKPEAAPFQRFCEISGLEAKDCVFIDDKEANVQTAKELGWNALVFQHEEKDGQLKDSAELLVEQLRTHGVPI